MTNKTVLVVGVGNLLLSDEGVGIHILQRLEKMPLPPEVELIDGGTLGFELIRYFERKKKVIIIDAVQAELEPGTLLRFTPDEVSLQWHPFISVHQTGLRELINGVQDLFPRPELIFYGIVPEEISRFGIKLSHTIQQRLNQIIPAILDDIVKDSKQL
jgi:hydrogenase maturation protease